MAGHSHWANIQHKKARVDAKRGKIWTKLARQVMQAARQGGGDPDANPSLRLAVDKARAANMPRDTIERSIKKGTGELGSENIEEMTYEGYGPAGVAVLCKILTDNRNRTAPEVKKIFERAGGNLGQPNCVAWMFNQKGMFVIPGEGIAEDRLMELTLEAGADDVVLADGIFEVTCSPAAFQEVKAALQRAGIPCDRADLTMLPSTTVRIAQAEEARKVLKLMETLDDHDDIQSVAANFDIPDEIMSQIKD
jgi:YebC/PmpR family DNA-binding regulatory protein